MRIGHAIIASIAMALAIPASADSTQGITDATIVIGNLGPFSGPSSVFTPLNYGPEAYLRYINEQGGVNGRKFTTVFADDSCNEAKGIAAAKKLIYEDKVFMIMSNPCSGVAMAIKPMLVQDGVPWIGASANPKISRPVSPSIFHTTYTGIESGRAMASFAMGKPGTTKIALAMHSDDWAHGYCDNATDYVKSHNGEIVATTALEHGATDGTAQALQIKASGAQAVMACLYQPELIVLLRELQKFQINVIVLGALGADFDQVVQAFPNHDYLNQRFFQPYQFKAKIGTRSAEEVPRHLRQVPDQGRAAEGRRTDQLLLLRRSSCDRDGGGVPPRRTEPDARELGEGSGVAEGLRHRRAGRYRDLRLRQACRRRENVRGRPECPGTGNGLQVLG